MLPCPHSNFASLGLSVLVLFFSDSDSFSTNAEAGFKTIFCLLDVSPTTSSLDRDFFSADFLDLYSSFLSMLLVLGNVEIGAISSSSIIIDDVSLTLLSLALDVISADFLHISSWFLAFLDGTVTGATSSSSIIISDSLVVRGGSGFAVRSIHFALFCDVVAASLLTLPAFVVGSVVETSVLACPTIGLVLVEAFVLTSGVLTLITEPQLPWLLGRDPIGPRYET
uniref:SSD domain-containing protein n=1 Tax=Glossina brevipalpis TaxID=37001 RepID=A0A1A9W2R5_9MUSC